MQRKKSLIFGLICGIACMVGVFLYLQEAQAAMEKERQEALARYGGEQVEVYVATKDVHAGETIDAANAEKRLWLATLLPEGAVSNLEDIAAKPATATVYQGEVLVKGRFDAAERAALQVPQGLCAVSVPSKSVTAVGGSVAPGSSVDVYATSGTSTDLIASKVEVLSTSAIAAGEKAGEGAPDVTWVTLAVKPDLVEELIAASQRAELYFSLPGKGVGGSNASRESDALDASSGADADAGATGSPSATDADESPSSGAGSEGDLAEKSESTEGGENARDLHGSASETQEGASGYAASAAAASAEKAAPSA